MTAAIKPSESTYKYHLNILEGHGEIIGIE